MLNSFLGIGRLGQDAALFTARNGSPMAKFSIAIDRKPKPDPASEPDWIPCHVFGNYALAIAPHLVKGYLVGVHGRLQSFRTTSEPSRELMHVHVQQLMFLRRPAARIAGTSPPAA